MIRGRRPRDVDHLNPFTSYGLQNAFFFVNVQIVIYDEEAVKTLAEWRSTNLICELIQDMTEEFSCKITSFTLEKEAVRIIP